MNNQKKARKVILIGLDGAIPEFVEKFGKRLPFMYKLIKEGVFTPALPSPPVDTPTNWTTIATGAWTRTHGINSFAVHLPGESFGKERFVFNTDLCQAEYIWEALERKGKRSILINYPVAYPIKIKNGIVIGGDGVFSRDWCVGNTAFYTTLGRTQIRQMGWGFGAGVKSINLKETKSWKNLPTSRLPYLETVIDMNVGVPGKWGPEGAIIDDRETKPEKEANYYILVYAQGKEGYDAVVLSKEKDFNKASAVLRKGDWSGWIYDDFIKNGRKVKASFQFKLVDLSKDGKKLELYRSECSVNEGWSYPENIAREVLKEAGPFHEGWELSMGSILRWFGIEVSLEHTAMQGDWMVKACDYLTHHYDWDLLAVQLHVQDYINHYCLSHIEPGFPGFNEKEAERCWKIFERTYQLTDELVGGIVEKCADENTVVIVLSDHGALPVKGNVRVLHRFIKEGLVSYIKDEKRKIYHLDLSKSKVFGNFWVNLKGREPHGIVKPGLEYEEVREKTIQILRHIKHPQTKESIWRLALRKEDAFILGLGGERVEDVVSLLSPGYLFERIPLSLPESMYPSSKDLEKEEAIWLPLRTSAVHGLYFPNAVLGNSSNRALFIMKGPGIKKNWRPPREINLVDVAPTISYLLNAPQPANCEGRVLKEFMDWER